MTFLYQPRLLEWKSRNQEQGPSLAEILIAE